MTNSLVQPLAITHDRIDPAVLEVIKKVDAIASTHGTKYFLAGATAREVILRHVFGRGPARRTLDVDFGIAVRDWQQFQSLKTALIQEAGFQAAPKVVHRLVYPGAIPVIVDLIPFGGVESSDRTIAWPPDEDIVMKVAGFSDAMESAVLVKLDELLTIRVVCIPALVVLKLFAWVDRKYESDKDAADILTILREYGDAGNEDRLYGDQLAVLEDEGFDFALAGARLCGIDAARIVSEDTYERAKHILESDRNTTELERQMIKSSGVFDTERPGSLGSLLARFRDAFMSAK
jgi:predicted nucleotidyltransferase